MIGASKTRAAVSAALLMSLLTATPERQEVGAQPAPVKAGDRAALAAAIDAIVAGTPELAQSRLGVAVMDVSTGAMLYERDASGPYNIASNNKVLTSAAALHLLGPNHSFRTELRAASVEGDAVVGDLYVVGGGDPTLDRARLRELVDSLARRGIRTVRGAVAIDDTRYDGAVLPPRFDAQPKEQAAFRAPVGAVSLERNAVGIWLRPAPGGVGPAVVGLDPPNDYVRIVGAVQTTRSGRNTVRMTSKVAGDHLEIRIGGQLPVSAGLAYYRRRIDDPALYFAAALRAELEAAGISVKRRKTERAAAPETSIVLTAVHSAPLAEVIRLLGKRSDNFTAEMLLKAIGAAALDAPRPATWDDGLAAARGFLEAQVGLEAGTYRYDNGSGLFDASAITPRQMVAVLAHVARDPRHNADLVSSLSIGGVDGTLRRRMKDSAAAGLVRAKTGTLASVSTLAGFVAFDARKPLAFAVFLNDQPATYKGKKAGRAALDRIVGALAEYLGSTPP